MTRKSSEMILRRVAHKQKVKMLRLSLYTATLPEQHALCMQYEESFSYEPIEMDNHQSMYCKRMKMTAIGWSKYVSEKQM